MTSKVAKKIALSILCNFSDYTCHEGSVIDVDVHMVVMKCTCTLVGEQNSMADPLRRMVRDWNILYQSSVFPNQYRVKSIYVSFFYF